jgi:hypothetical protein
LKKATLEFLAALLYRAQRPRTTPTPALDGDDEGETTEGADADPAEETPAGPTSVEELGENLSPHLVEELRAFLAAYAPATLPPAKEATVDATTTATVPTASSDNLASLPPLVD